MIISIVCALFRKKMLLILFFLSFAAASIWVGYQKRKPIMSVASAILKTLKRPIQKKIKGLSCSCTWNSMPFKKKNYYRLHRKSASELTDAALISDFETQIELQSKGILVPIANSTGYLVKSMNYGSPYLHREALEMLEEIEERYLKRQQELNLPIARFVISSAARTEDQQEALRGKTSAATKGISSHSYGASIDIPKIIGKRCSESRDILLQVLEEMQLEKKVYLCPESTTIHVTAR